MVNLLFTILLASPLPDTGSTSTEALVVYALENHPKLRAEAQRVRAAQAGVDAEGYWAPPQLGVGFNPLPLETRNGPAWGAVKLKQALPWPSELAARTERAGHGVEVARARLDEARIKVARGVRVAVAALRRVEALRAINRRTVAVVVRLVELAQSRLGVNAGGQTDVLEAQVALAELQNEALDLEARRAIAAVALNTALGREARAKLPKLQPPEAADDTVEALLERARAKHPALARLKATAAAHRARAKIAAASALPRFTVGVGYTFIGEPSMAAPGSDGGRDALHLEGGLSIPLWTGAEAAEASAEAAASATVAARDDVERQLALAVIAAHTQVQTAQRTVALYTHTVLPLARQRLEVLEGRYGVNRVGFSVVLEAQQALQMYETKNAHAAAAVAMAIADLHAATGEAQ